MIEITAGAAEQRGEGFQSRDTVTQATATAKQALSLTTNYSLLTPSGGTATAFGDGGVSLADGRDGQVKQAIMTATGDMTLHLTSTGNAFQFADADDLVVVRFLNGKWRQIVGSARATAT